MNKALALVRTWLVIDFFGDARRAGRGHGSSLTTTIFTQGFLALVFAMLMYPDVPPVPFAAANLSLSSLLVAIGALGDDARPGRFAADEVLLRTAPLRPSVIALARAGHAAFYVLLVTLGMAVAPAVLLTHLTGNWLHLPGYLLAATACAAAASGALGVVSRAARRWLGGTRAALLQGTLKAALLGGGLVGFAIGMRRLQGTADELPIGRLGAELLLPYHAAKLLWAPTAEAWRWLPFAGTAAVLALAALLLTTTSHERHRAAPQSRVLLPLLRSWCRSAPQLGVAEFVATSMWRSAGFRARVLPLLGIPVGMTALAVGGQQKNDFVLMCLLLQLPAIYLPFLLAFLPRADQPGTAWVFDHSPAVTVALVRDATWRALVSHVLLPVHAFAAVILLAASAHRVDAIAASAFALGLAALAAQAMVRSLTSVPFTRAGEAGAGVDLGSAFAAALLLGGLGTAFALLLDSPLRWLAAAIVVVAALRRLRQPAELGGAVIPAESQTEGLPEAAAGPEDPAEAARSTPATLGRELRAIAVLYGALCLLPWLIGTAFAN